MRRCRRASWQKSAPAFLDQATKLDCHDVADRAAAVGSEVAHQAEGLAKDARKRVAALSRWIRAEIDALRQTAVRGGLPSRSTEPVATVAACHRDARSTPSSVDIDAVLPGSVAADGSVTFAEHLVLGRVGVVDEIAWPSGARLIAVRSVTRPATATSPRSCGHAACDLSGSRRLGPQRASSAVSTIVISS